MRCSVLSLIHMREKLLTAMAVQLMFTAEKRVGVSAMSQLRRGLVSVQCHSAAFMNLGVHCIEDFAGRQPALNSCLPYIISRSLLLCTSLRLAAD